MNLGSKVYFAGLVLAPSMGVCLAQGFPAKPIRFVSPYPPGGPNDVVARMIAQRMTQAFGQPWIVENRPGRGGNIGVELVAKSPADGYTVVHGGMGSLTLAPFLSKLPYDALRDFAPVTLTARVPNAIAVHPSLPVKSVPELIALARARPEQLNYGTPGVGSTPHLTAALFLSLAKIKLAHIPYKGSAPATIDLVAGQIPILFTPLSPLLPQIESGKVRAIGVSSLQRSPLLSGVPTIHESGLPGFEMNPWFSILAPAGTPREVVARLNAEVTRYLRTPEAAKQFAAQGADAAYSSSEELTALIKSDLSLWGKVIRENNIQGE
jgi:tripartite-type tricarboxylate transporter receptor subunit TctC